MKTVKSPLNYYCSTQKSGSQASSAREARFEESQESCTKCVVKLKMGYAIQSNKSPQAYNKFN